MATLTINGVNLSGVVATVEDPRGERRDIGEQYGAVDGSLRVTRQARKRDLSFKTVPLTDADSMVWESLFTGEGEVWSFDASLYGSKGLGPSSSSGATLVSGSPKFGAKNLRLAATTGSIAYTGAAANIFGSSSSWTVMVWRFESGAWHHYIVRSDGSKWYDGVQNNALSTTWLTVSSGTVTIANTAGSSQDFDDLVVLPFKVLDTWPAVLGVASSAFPPLPYLDIAGDLVPEQPTRRVLGQVAEQLKKVAGGQRHFLDVHLQAK